MEIFFACVPSDGFETSKHSVGNIPIFVVIPRLDTTGSEGKGSS